MPTPSSLFSNARRLRAVFVLTAICLALAALCASQALPERRRAQARRVADGGRPTPRALEAYGKLPIRFEANRGQAGGAAKFLARGAGYTLFLSDEGATLRLKHDAAKGDDKSGARSSYEYSTLRVRLEGSNRSPKVSGVEEMSGRSNYLVGRDPRRWLTGVPVYAKVAYESVYPGVDVVYYGNEGRLEYDFLVAPGADARRISLRFDGARSTRVEEGGDLLITTPGGDVRQQKPRAYQDVDGARREVAARYFKDKRGAVRIELGEYERSLPLVIDPVLLYASYVGGVGFDQGLAVAVDSAGAAYVAGSTANPASGPAGSTHGPGGDVDAFVVKLAPDGKSFVYATYLGGDGPDAASDIAVDSAGNAYAAGQTASNNFPVTAGASQTNNAGVYDGFVVKLNATGTGLTYSTYFGGGGSDIINEVAIDGAGAAYVAGRIESVSFNGFPSATRAGNPVFKSTNAGASWAASALGLGASVVNGFAVAPNAPDTVYAATNLGVYKSTDGGATWQLTGQSSPSTAPFYATAVAVDPSNASVVYAGTPGGGGLYKSIDGGATYEVKANGLAVPFVNSLAVDPSNTQTVYAGTLFGVYKTTNGGGEWTSVNSGVLASQPNVYRVVIDPSNTQTVYVGTNRGVFKTTNGAATWAAANNGLSENGFTPQARALAISPSSPSTLYTYVSVGASIGVYKTTDGGASWTKASNDLSGEVFFVGVNVLLVDPSSPSIVYAGTFGSGVYKTTDGGANWAASNAGLPNKNVTALASRPAAPAAVYAGVSVGGDAFAAKLNASGSQFEYVRVFGGVDNDDAGGLAIGADGSAYVSGTTVSGDFPTANAYQSALKGSTDAFVAKLGPTGTTVYSTYLGGSSFEQSGGLAVGADGSAYVTGTTFSLDFPVANALQPSRGDELPVGDAFVTKLAPSGQTLTYSTYLGGDGNDQGNGVAVGADGSAYVTGLTNSTDFPTHAPSNTPGGNNDAFVTRINPAGSALLFSTYFGGTLNDQGNAIALDSAGGIYVAGTASSTDLPAAGSADSTPGGNNDGFVAKFGLDANLSLSNVDSRDPVMVNNNLTYTLTVTNEGADDADGVVLTDIVPAGTTFVSVAASQGTCAGTSTVTCNLGKLVAGAGAAVNITITPKAVGNITNAASVTSSTPDRDTSNNNALQQTRVSALPSIAGRVTTGAGVGGVTVFLINGAQTSNTITNAAGFYQFGDLASGGTYHVTPSHPAYVFHPDSRTLANLTADATADFTAVACVFQIAPRNASFPASGGSGVVTVTAPDGLCPWTATSDVPWITITGNAQSAGTNNVTFTVAPTNIPRAGTLRIAGHVFTVWQELSPCDPPTFTKAPTYEAGTMPFEMAKGDFNDDGKTDVVVLNDLQFNTGTSGKVSVLLATGPGGFEAPRDFTVGNQPRDVAVGDFNNDGKADVVVVTFAQTNNVLVYLGDGTGNLGQPATFSAANNPASVAVGDFNNDGKADLAVGRQFSGFLYVLLGAGNGQFTAAPAVAANDSSRVIVGDFNKDGRADLVTGGDFGTFLFISNGDGTFAAPVTLSTPLRSFVTADFNKDGNPDIAGATNLLVGNDVVPAVTALLGDGAGNFGARIDSPTGGRSVTRVTAADFNGDGNQDLGALNAVNDANVLFGNGAGSFSPGPAYVAGVSPRDLVAADFNGDGRQDFAVANGNLLTGDGGLTVLLNKGASGFVGARSFLATPQLGVSELESKDFDGDGTPDLLSFNNFSVTLLKGVAPGEFGPPAVVASGDSPYAADLGTRPVSTEDFNHDGKPDFAYHTLDSSGGVSQSRVKVFFNNGAGGFTLAGDTLLNFSSAVLIRDLNGDVTPDIVFRDVSGNLAVRLGDGQGGFGPSSVILPQFNSGIWRIEAGDFNGDGRADLAVATHDLDPFTNLMRLRLFYGNGQGGFSAPTLVPYDGLPSAMRAYDLNGDGRDDLVTIAGAVKKMRVLLSDGSGGFTAGPDFDVGTDPSRFFIQDLSGDAKPDLLVGNNITTPSSNTVNILTGDGAGGFGPPVPLATLAAPASAAFGDFDRNGHVDVALAGFYYGGVGLYLNSCPVAQTGPAVQFGAAGFSANESAGAVNITVTRTGDASGAATVRYSTQAGSASPRTDYTTAVGTLRFAAGETSKTFQVLLTDDALVEGDESLTLALTDPTGLALGTTNSVVLNIVDNDASAGANPINDSTFFVRQHYHDFLNREPDAAGLAFWVNEIEKCGADAQCREVRRINVSAAFFLSIEFQETGYLVERIYKAAYGDTTSPNVPGTVPVIRLEDFLPDTQQIGAGLQVGVGDWQARLEENKQAYAFDFVQRPRFLADYPVFLTPQQFVDKLNARAGMVLTEAERENVIRELEQNILGGNVPGARATALRRIAENSELRRRELNRAFVLMQYFGYLRRNPDDPRDADFRGWKFWLDKLDQFNGNFVQAEMVKAFLSSDEYRKRFGQ